MTASKLKPALRSLVREHGLGEVLKSLGEIAESRHGSVKQLAVRSNGAEKKVRRRKPRLTATGVRGEDGYSLPISRLSWLSLQNDLSRKISCPTLRPLPIFVVRTKLKCQRPKSVRTLSPTSLS